MRQTEHRIRLDKLVIIFNARYPTTFSKRILQRICNRIGIEIHFVPSKPPNYGRPSMSIMTEDVPRLQAEIRYKVMQDADRLPVDDEQREAAQQRFKATDMSTAEIARRTGINYGTLSQIFNGKQVMKRGQLAKIQQVLKEIEG